MESNYITNGSYAQGIPNCNRGMLDQQIMVSQDTNIISAVQGGASIHSQDLPIVGKGASFRQNNNYNETSLISQSMQLTDEEEDDEDGPENGASHQNRSQSDVEVAQETSKDMPATAKSRGKEIIIQQKPKPS